MELSTSEPTTARFDALYRATASDVFAYAMTLVRDRAAAEDVTAQTFERAYRRQSSFDAKRGTQRAWLFGIARNAALDELRRRKRSVTLTHDVEDDAPLPSEERDPLQRAAVRAALAGLDPRDRELVLLKFVAGLSNAEIAEVIGASPTNAGTRLHRVVTKLREACNA